ncbi:MAG TPA: class IIb bacteriocin, lactobin A/cerein 7B family [Flavobacterium sp.]|jgi:lactobin A/cerein 7B family class IIb bacteriocin|nr:class IIb bacteriocin, lactobin A/cerein 7B family [Flavobacterium sp.]
MKKQNVNNKLAFNKAVIVELNNDQLADINGGATPTIVVTSSGWCLAGAGAVVGGVVAWIVN